ncbi:hypothetical protein ACSBOX_11610 [Arthrobacter sp. KN11-1C]|uniref:hypothetical protein n=1 Tax=Arthrobacter sp. KN11-1C TaxID=3445774 RepID=UPI003FA18D46
MKRELVVGERRRAQQSMTDAEKAATRDLQRRHGKRQRDDGASRSIEPAQKALLEAWKHRPEGLEYASPSA